MLDLRTNSSRNNNENNSNRNLGSKQQAADASINTSITSTSSNSSYSSHAKRWRHEPQQSFESKTSEQDLDKSYSTSTSPSLDEQAENLTMSGGGGGAASEDGSSASPDKGQYLGKSPYLSSPFHLQKKSQLKQERWTPSTPLPTTPECRQCGYSFDSFDVLSDHNEAVHSVFTCQHCHKTFTSRSNLERHSRLHTGFKPYVCAICGKAFSRKDHLSNHSAKHAFKCGNCNKRYADKQSLAQHFSLEHEAMLTNTCEFCNKGFSSLEACEEHVKTHPQYQAVQRAYQGSRAVDQPPPPPPASTSQVAAKPPRHSCDACKFSAHDRVTLMKHRLLHLDAQRSYTCSVCTKTFSDPLQYDEHVGTHDGQLNVVECILCRQVFPTLDVLRRHEVLHANDDDVMSGGWPCPHCAKVLKSLPSLQEHIMQHAAQSLANKKHKCMLCNMAFGTYPELCRHMDELRHYPPDPRMLFHFGMHQQFGAPFNGRKLADMFAFTEHKHAHLQQQQQNGLPASTPAHEKPPEQSPKLDEPARQESAENNESAAPSGETNDDMNDESREEANNEEAEEEESDRPDAELENDIGSDIEVVEPEAPEDDASSNQNQADSFKEELEAERRNGGDESPAIQNQPVKSMLCNKNSNNSAVVAEHRIKEEERPKVDTEETTRSEAAICNGSATQTTEELSREAAKRARKRKWPSPEKYVNNGEAMDMSMNDYYNNCDIESLPASESSNLSSSNGFDLFPPTNPFTLPNMFPRGSPTQSYDPKHGGERKREVSRITPNKMSVDIPPGPCTCSICQQTLDSFHSLEQHCFAEHSRCPCMFCPKTFAQKANRDRHVCLHTGDKPYACPECGEKFSRGDKLKLHRVRTHNIPTNPTGYGKARDGLPAAAGRDWTAIPSPSTNASLEHDAWGLISPREDAVSSMLPGGGEWLLPDSVRFPTVTPQML